MVAVWPAIHTERQALLTDLEPLSEQQWQTPSLCSQWTVQQVFGHIITTAQMTPPKFLAGMLGSGFNFAGFIAKNADRFSAATPAEMLAAYRGLQHRTNHPPGPNDTWLGEAIVHAEDIRRPSACTATTPSTRSPRSPTPTRDPTSSSGPRTGSPA